TRTQLADDGLPAAFINKTLRAAAVLRVIFNSDFGGVELDLQVFTPTSLGPPVECLLGHGGIAGEVNSDWLLLCRSRHHTAQNNKCQSRNSYSHISTHHRPSGSTIQVAKSKREDYHLSALLSSRSDALFQSDGPSSS